MHNFESWPIGTCTDRGVGELRNLSENVVGKFGAYEPQEVTQNSDPCAKSIKVQRNVYHGILLRRWVACP